MSCHVSIVFNDEMSVKDTSTQEKKLVLLSDFYDHGFYEFRKTQKKRLSAKAFCDLSLDLASFSSLVLVCVYFPTGLKRLKNVTVDKHFGS